MTEAGGEAGWGGRAAPAGACREHLEGRAESPVEWVPLCRALLVLGSQGTLGTERPQDPRAIVLSGSSLLEDGCELLAGQRSRSLPGLCRSHITGSVHGASSPKPAPALSASGSPSPRPFQSVTRPCHMASPLPLSSETSKNSPVFQAFLARAFDTYSVCVLLSVHSLLSVANWVGSATLVWGQ